jgi:UDP-N-acetylglucosamine acyltransferase
MSLGLIHPSAIIEEGAEISAGVKIGPFCYVGPKVKIFARVELKSHVVVSGQTSVGEDTIIFPFSSIGEIPQDLKFSGEKTSLVIGKRNRIREGVTMNVGTSGGGGLTVVGDDCLFMTGSHVAHDTIIGNGVIMANQAAVAGHCIIQDNVIIGGLSGIHQFVRVGRGAIIGAVTMVTNDVIPYGLVQASRGDLDGLNYVGLKRAGTAREDITALRAGYQMLKQGDGTFQDRARKLLDETESVLVKEVVDFILSDTDRSFLIPR